MGFLTHTPSDYPSLLLWFLDETHITVTAATAATILYTQQAHAVWFATGAFGATLVARTIKHMIRQPRPPPPEDLSQPSPVRPKRTYGMPSTHSTALGFYLVYLWPLLPLTLTSAGAWVERAALVAVTGLGLWSRVKLGYHTVPQVVVGAGVGFASALAWAAVWSSCPEIGPALQDVIDRVRGMIL